MKTESSVDFIFGLHFHQPVGNFERILENAYRDAYKPIIESFKNYKNLKLNLHITSPLLDFFKENHSGFLEEIKNEIDKGRIEMLGGGFYEPVLTSIPKQDISGQLKKTEKFLIKHFNVKPRGIWLTERVWEPHLPSLLNGTGAEYLAVDDTHFIQAGFLPERLTGYYLTEDCGNKLGLFIINKTLRYYIPFKPVNEIIDCFRKVSRQSEKPLLCMLDDGEKFGVWPNTKQWVHEKGWLENFFKALEDNSSWIKMRTLSEYYDSNSPLGRVCLPACQYYEMKEWSMPTEGALKVESLKKRLTDCGLLEETEPYLAGGIWRNYFAKYPESNYTNKKMLYLSHLLQQRESDFTDPASLEKARDFLYRSQCNCSYWHGVFGGIYLPHLRSAVHSNLIRLHKILDSTAHKEKFVEYNLTDLDCDGKDELLLNTDSLFLCVSPYKGGMIEDISDKITSINHLDTVARRKETYHNEILQENESNTGDAKKDGIESIHDIKASGTEKFTEYLHFDKYMRKSLIEHIMPPGSSLENFIHQDYENFRAMPCSIEVKEAPGKITAIMESMLTDRLKSLKLITVEEGKREFSVHISLKNISSDVISPNYGIEFNFAMLTDKSDEKKYILDDETAALDKTGCVENIRSFGVYDGPGKYKTVIQVDRECSLWYYPVRVVSNSEKGFELSYQSSCMMPVFQPEIPSGGEFNLRLDYTIQPLS